MFPFPLPPGGSEPIDLGEGMMLVGFQLPTPELVTQVEATLKAAGWDVETSGGLHMGGMWSLSVSKGSERWMFTAQGVDDSSQLGISRAED
jgi:hypothetical protein